MTKEYEQRIEYIDIAKGIGIILIVLGHVLKNGFLRQYSYSFHVPLFFFLSGLTYKFKNDKKIKKKIIRIYIPYIVFSIISILVFFLLGKIVARKMNIEFMDGTIKANIIGMLYANSRNGLMKWNTPLWFLPCLLVVYLIANYLESIFKKYGEKIRIISICISIIFTWYISTYFRNIKLPFGIEEAIFMYSFFELGIIIKQSNYINKINNKIKSKLQQVFLAVFFLILVIPVSYINGMAQVRIMMMGRHFILFLISSICGICGIILISISLQKLKSLSYLGKNTMVVLLMHKFPILLFQSIIPGTKIWLKNGNNLSGIFSAILVTIITIYLCLILGKIIERICPIIIGKKRKV